LSDFIELLPYKEALNSSGAKNNIAQNMKGGEGVDAVKLVP